MKSRRKKRLLAMVLCVVMILSLSISVMAEGSATASDGTESEAMLLSDGTGASETTTEPTPEPTAEPTPEVTQTPEATPEVTPEPVATTPIPTPEAVQGNNETLQADVTAGESQTSGVRNVETQSVTPSVTAQTAAVVFSQTVDNMTVVVTAQDETVLPADAELSVTKIESEAQVEEIKDAVAEDIAANNTTIQDMTVLDIKFLVNGQEVQPNGTVTVEFENTGYDAENGISVYHVDGTNTTAVNMNATTETEADVAFETTHFSTYVVINQGTNEITATIEHYLNGDNDTSSPLYRTQTVQIPSGKIEGQMTNFTKESDEFKLDKVVIVDADGQEEEVPGDRILVESNVTLRCYYNATSGSYQNGTTFFDYDTTSIETETDSFRNNAWVTIQVGKRTYSGYYRQNALYSYNNNRVYSFSENDEFVYAGQTCEWIGNGQYSSQTTSSFNAGINSDANYGNSNRNNRLSVGQTGNNLTDYTYYVTYRGDRYNANVNNQADYPVIPGLIDNLSGTNYENVNFVPDEPGLFSSEEKEGKRILDGYELQFERNGNTYTLTSVVDENGRTVVSDLSNFWPLDNNTSIDGLSGGSDDGGSHNWYFGMRYDFQFSLGDYVGDLTYSFNGDDDLWVFLDGEPIIDLGGMHSAYPVNSFSGSNYDYSRWVSIYSNECDLWELILGEDYTEADKANLTDEQRQETHTITVLFMERGGYGSNCEMEFVLPNVTPSQPVISSQPRATLEFTKRDLNDNTVAIEGAVFGLYSDESCSDLIEDAVSGSDGKVTFSQKLTEGTYYLKEISAASGYLLNQDVYTVIVTATDTTATAVLQDKNGNILTSNEIYNQKIETAITQSKTAHVASWDDRTYNITLNASSTAQSVSSYEPVDIVLAFDVSGSMLFPSSLEYYGTGTSGSANLDKDEVYYWIEEPSGKATVYEVWHNGSRWVYRDASYSDEQPTTDLGSGSYTFYTSNDNDTNGEPITRLYYLKQAAIQFVKDVAEVSPNTRISLITFAKGSSIAVEMGATLAENKDGLINAINGLSTSGGTNQTAALQDAKGELDKTVSEGRKQYVILLTDGSPNADGCNATTIRNAASAITADSNRTLMTIGVNLDQITATKELMEEIASPDSDGNKYAFNAASGDQISGILTSVFQTIMENIPVTNATIKDYIDPRFDVDEASVEAAGGTVGSDSNGTYVIWENQMIPAASSTGTAGWSKTFQVKAKDDYIGGNNVTTNGDGSGVTVGDTTLEFENPVVNVKIELEVGNYETTIFKGDTVSTTSGNVVDQLFDVEAVVDQYNNSEDPISEDDLELKWYKNSECTDEATEDEIQKAMTNPDEDVTLYLKVIYTGAGEPTDDSTANTDDHVAGYDDGTSDIRAEASNVDQTNYPGAYYGVYKVKVITGEIQITKTLDKATNKDQIFEFTVSSGALSNPVTVSVTVKAGDTSGTLSPVDAAKLQKLARGEYTVQETAVDGYDLQQIATGNDTNCKFVVSTENVVFTLGTFLDGEDEKDTIADTNGAYDEGILGVAEFTNEESMGDWAIKKVSSSDNTLVLPGAEFTLTKQGDSGSEETIYYGKTDSAGIVVWYQDSDRTEEMTGRFEGGTYLLEETKAPTGYVKSTANWTVTISAGGNLQSIMLGSTPVTGTSETIDGTEITCFYFENTVLYELPSAGGPGIHMYMVGGVLLMSAGVLMIYRNKRREVLRRK